jgi:hypothetical protein
MRVIRLSGLGGRGSAYRSSYPHYFNQVQVSVGLQESKSGALGVLLRFPFEMVSMRGNDNRNASRLKSYGRFLNGFCVLLMDADFSRPQVNG